MPAGKALRSLVRAASLRRRIARVGLALAGAAALAVANARLAKLSEARHPPRGRFVIVDGVRLHYLDEGEGPPIVLIHGVALSGADFVASGLVGALSRTHRVIVFDRPGYGYSSRPRRRIWTAKRQASLLARALAALAVDRPLVVGHSHGALVAAYMGLLPRTRPAGLVLISGYYRPTLRPDVTITAASALPVAGDALRFTLSPWLARLMTPLILRLVFAPAPVSPSFSKRYPISQALRPSQIHATAADLAWLGWDAFRFAPEAQQLTLPVLLVAGREDRLLRTESHSAWLHRQLPAANILQLSGAGHMVHHTKAAEVAARILRFAAGSNT